MSFSSSFRLTAAAFTSISVLALSVLLTGCGIGEVDHSIPAPTGSVTISGKLMGGETPISGSYIQLWQAGSGYGSGATQLKTGVYTSTNGGQFSFAIGSLGCTSGSSQVYITGTGGDPTDTYGHTDIGFAAANNKAIRAAVLLGSCSNISDNTVVTINELTTVAAAYAAGHFASDGTTGSGSAGSVTNTAGDLNIGAPSTNSQGLADAFATANLLVNSTSGTAASSTSTVLLPTAMINALGDILVTCVNSTGNSSGPNSTNCQSLMTDATTPTGSVPYDTFQAMQNIAAYPGSNAAAIIGLVPSTGAAFPTTISAGASNSTINDLSLGIMYLDSTLQADSNANQNPNLAIDSKDNIWVVGIADANYNVISELTSPSSGSVKTDTDGSTTALAAANNIRDAVFDKTGNLWMSNGAAAQIIEIPYNSGTSTLSSPSAATTVSFGSLNSHMSTNTWAIAADASGNIFATSYKKQGGCAGATVSSGSSDCEYLEAVNNSGVYTATNTGNAISANSVRAMAVDARSGSTHLGNVWGPQYGNSSGPGSQVLILTPGTGSTATATTGGTGYGPWGVALDATSGGWIDTSSISGLYFVTASGTTGAAATSASATGVPNTTSLPTGGTTATIGGLNTPSYDAIDGAGRVFVANSGNASVVEYAPTAAGAAAGVYLSPYYGFAPSLALPAQTVTITAYTATTSAVTFTGTNSFVPGQVITFSGLPSPYTALNSGSYTVLLSNLSGTSFSVSYSGTSQSSSTAISGTAAAPATTQALFTCASSGSTTCSIVGSPISSSGIAIDRAGSVWTLQTYGALLQMVGLAAPTDPIQADGAYGVLP